MKTVFTTGEAAKICHVASRTVVKWFDSGKLRGYRIPGSQDRRIPREQLIRFLKENGMPLGPLDRDGVVTALIIGPDPSVRQALQQFVTNGSFQLEYSANEFEAGSRLNSLRPDCVIIDFAMGENRALSIAHHLSTRNEQLEMVLIALATRDVLSDAFEGSLFRETFRKPFDPALLVERIKSLASRKKPNA